jgi:hypothetical protein
VGSSSKSADGFAAATSRSSSSRVSLTNNLDLTNVDFLAGIVRGFRGAVIVVSHDQRFLENCGILQELLV